MRRDKFLFGLFPQLFEPLARLSRFSRRGVSISEARQDDRRTAQIGGLGPLGYGFGKLTGLPVCIAETRMCYPRARVQLKRFHAMGNHALVITQEIEGQSDVRAGLRRQR